MAQRVVAAEVPAITLEEILAIKHPDPAVWSPDGRWLAWRWDDGGVVSLWAAPDGGAPLRVSREAGEASVGGFSWSPDGRLAYAHARDLWLARPGEVPERLSAEP